MSTSNPLSPPDPEALDAVRSESRVSSDKGEPPCPPALIGACFDAAGPLSETESSGRDITAHQAAESALRDSEAKYRLLFDNLDLGVFVQLADGSLLDVNAAALAMFGLEREEFLGRNSSSSSWDVVNADGMPVSADEHPSMRALSNGQLGPDRVLGVFNPRRGEHVWMAINTIPLTRPGEALPCQVIVTLHDITEQRARQAKLEGLVRTQSAIGRVNQALLHATDEAGFANEVCRIVVEDCGHALAWIDIAEQGPGRALRPIAHAGLEQNPPSGLDTIWAGGARGQGPTGTVLRSGQPCICHNLAEDADFAPWRMEAQRRGYAAFASFPIVGARGDVFGAISLCSREIDPFTVEEVRLLGVIASDLAFGMRTLRLRADHAEAEATMAAMRGEFQQLLEWQVASQTVTSIAHEIGQPLNAVTTFGEAASILLENLSPRPEKLAQAVQGMAVQAERAGHVLRELMQFLRHSESTMEAFDLDDLVRCTVALARADRRRVGRIALVGVPDLKAVWGNRLQIEKVLLNLFSNSMDAMREAGLSGSDAGMSVTLSDDGDMARVSVSDMGPGIDQVNAQRIFEPFFSSKTKGIGMGLSISRSLIEAHGGRLWLEPGKGLGATFHFTVPFAP